MNPAKLAIAALVAFFALAPVAHASPTYVGKTTASGATTSLVVTAPTGTVSGDVQLAFVQVGTQSETLGAAPTGWTKLQGAINTSGTDSAQTAVYLSTTVTGSSTFTKSGARGWFITRVDYMGAAGTIPSSGISIQSVASTAHATPAVTATAGDTVVGLVGEDRGTNGTAMTWTPPTGWTERQDQQITVGTNPDLESETIADKVAASTGSVTGTFTSNVSDDSINSAVVIAASGTDTTPPDTSITSNPANPTTSTSASFSFTGTDNVGVTSFECRLDGAAFATCTSPQSYSSLAVGSHTFDVRAKDAAGNVDATPATYTWTINSGWTTVLDDEFNTGSSDLTPWSLYSGPYGSNFENCADPSQVSVSGGFMHMLMSYRSDLAACGGTGQPQTHWYTSGMMVNHAYGGNDQRVTMRWRIVSTDSTNVVSHRIMPMRFFDCTGCTWPSAGEEDWCEGSSLAGCAAYFHAVDGNCEYALPNCVDDYTLDQTAWHTTRIERITTGTSVTANIYIDNLSTPAVTGTTTTTHMPDTFKRVVLQQECRGSTGCPSSTYAGQTEDIQVDWITIENKG